MSNIIAIVVTYNRKKLLEEALNALLKQTYKQFDILIVDNASTDDTYNVIKEKFLEFNKNFFHYINTGSNLGGAGGFNIGIKYALENNYEYAWLMDDDTIASEDALKSLVNKAKKVNYKFSYLSSLCKWTDGTLAKMNKQHLNNNFLEDYKNVNNKLLLLEKASFVSFFLNLKAARKVGLPYKEFFIYGDDWEYCLRLNNIYPGYLDLDSEVIHKIKENKGANIFLVDKERIDRNFYNYRNLSFTYRKYSKKRWIKYLVKEFIFEIIRIPFKAKNYRIKRIFVCLKGNICGLFFNPKIEYIN